MRRRFLRILSITVVSVLFILNCIQMPTVASASPKLGYHEISSDLVKVSEFETSFENSGKNRSHNVTLATKHLNNTLIFPNEEFSFNETVGRRDAKRGFLEAKIIVNSKYQDGIGGGVCQVSTTLYNTALLMGLKITESHQHSLQSTYVSPSFDAMVDYGRSDLKFVNNTDSVILIKAHTENKRVIVTMYSTKKDDGVTIIRKSEVDQVLPYDEKVIYDSTNEFKELGLKIDESGFIAYGKNGLVATSYLIFMKDGIEVDRKKVRTSYYKPQDAVKVIRVEKK